VYEHRDYTKPLQVEPVCRSCNALRGPGKPYLHLSARTLRTIQRREAAAHEAAR
jgi:hypothetical protein